MAIASVGVKQVDSQRAATGVSVPTWVFKPVADDTRANRMSNQAVQLLKSGDPRGALRLLDEALALPAEKGTDLAALQNRKGVAYNRLGEHTKAIAQFDLASAQGAYPPAVYNKAVSSLKSAIADSGQWEAFSADKASVDPSKLDGARVAQALDLLKQAVGANGEFFSKMAREDTDWSPLLQLPALRELIGLEPMQATTASVASTFAAGGTPPAADDPAKRAEDAKWYGANQKGLGFETR